MPCVSRQIRPCSTYKLSVGSVWTRFWWYSSNSSGVRSFVLYWAITAHWKSGIDCRSVSACLPAFRLAGLLICASLGLVLVMLKYSLDCNYRKVGHFWSHLALFCLSFPDDRVACLYFLFLLAFLVAFHCSILLDTLLNWWSIHLICLSVSLFHSVSEGKIKSRLVCRTIIILLLQFSRY